MEGWQARARSLWSGCDSASNLQSGQGKSLAPEVTLALKDNHFLFLVKGREIVSSWVSL